MGVVYKAWDPVGSRELAVKVHKMDVVEGSAEETRLLKEARAMAQLSHGNIVTLYDIGREDESLFLAMEYIRGHNLSHMLKDKKRFSPFQAAEFGAQIADALDYAHRLGIVHRDIKPANILVNEDGTPKIADFGIARIIDLGLSMDNRIVGTPAYMSPEQVSGQPVDGRSDLFSLGVIIYEMATQQKPFDGETFTEVTVQIVGRDPRHPRAIDRHIPKPLGDIIIKALQKDPLKRFQTGREMAEALRAFAHGTGKPRSSTSATKSFLITVPVLLAMLAGGWYFYVYKQQTPIETPAIQTQEPAFLSYVTAITYPDGAEVWLDGKLKGISPTVLELTPGAHDLKFVKEGYKTKEAGIFIREDKDQDLEIDLEPLGASEN